MSQKEKSNTNVFVSLVKNLISKMQQSPDIYPIKYYKKAQRFRRHWHEPAVK